MTSTTKGGKQVTKTWLFSTDVNGRLNEIFEDADDDPSADANAVAALVVGAMRDLQPKLMAARELADRRKSALLARETKRIEEEAVVLAEQERLAAEHREELRLQAEATAEAEEEASKKSERQQKDASEREEAARRHEADSRRQQADSAFKKLVDDLDAACSPGMVYRGRWETLGKTGEVELAFLNKDATAYRAELRINGASRALVGTLVVTPNVRRAYVRLMAESGSGLQRTVTSRFKDPSIRWMILGSEVRIEVTINDLRQLVPVDSDTAWREFSPQ